MDKPPYPQAMNRLLSLSDWHMRLSQSDADALQEYVRWLFEDVDRLRAALAKARGE